MARTVDTLRQTLLRLDGRGYKAYRQIEGAYDFVSFELTVAHVQADPFAAPTRVRVFVPQRVAQFPAWTYRTPARAVGVADYLARAFHEAAQTGDQRRGTGGSGRIEIDVPGQEVLPRTAVLFDASGIEVRFRVGLPARGRRILGRQAADLLTEDVPRIVNESLLFDRHDAERVRQHAEVNEDAGWLRDQLRERGLVAFVADGARLPRRSGVDDRPLEEGVIAFASPPSLRVCFELPNGGPVEGMGIPRGVTLIVGGGYHGKSTLLRAVERGVYNHRPGDGREFVVTVADAVKIRAEDGRSVAGVDIRPFISNLPFGQPTGSFRTPNASGSTSQAANIMEALEVGTSLLLIDEDTSATNFMIRDHRMQRLIAKEHEPITPFIDRVRQLYDEHGVSTILVIGGSGDYFDVADTVIAMQEYRPHDVTAEARRIASEHPTGRHREGGPAFGAVAQRILRPESIDPSRGRRDVYTKVRGRDTIQLGTETIDLSAVEQLVARSQTRALAEAVIYARDRYVDGERSLYEVVRSVLEDVSREGLDVLDPRRTGELAYFRPFELAATLNRLRTIRTTTRFGTP